MASGGGKKRKALNIEEKVDIIERLKNNESNADICKSTGLVTSTVSTIWKNRDKILEAFEKNKGTSKRLKVAEKSDLDKAALIWFTQQRNENKIVTGPVFKLKIEGFARQLGYQDFKCSNGWLHRFKQRHGINHGAIIGEAADVNLTVTEEWLDKVWIKVKSGYNENDIFNCDETGLFYKLPPNKTLKFKGEKCVGGKLSKQRLTILLCANMSGTEKREVFVIGKSVRPHCFKHVKKLPVIYRGNSKAWMTSDFFSEYLRQWDLQLKKEKRKILLLVDNCPAHPHLNDLQCIKLVFFPPNCTSVVQPMDQGIIRSFKCFYRTSLLLKMIEADENKKPFKLNLIESLRIVKSSWDDVTTKTIKNCFAKAGLITDRTYEELWDEEDDMPLSQWLQRFHLSSHCDQDLDVFFNIDNDVITSEPLTDEMIISEIQNQDLSDVYIFLNPFPLN